jgi:hypothetical protein
MTDKEPTLTLTVNMYYLTKTLKVKNLDKTKVVQDSSRILFYKYRSPYEFCVRGEKLTTKHCCKKSRKLAYVSLVQHIILLQFLLKGKKINKAEGNLTNI